MCEAFVTLPMATLHRHSNTGDKLFLVKYWMSKVLLPCKFMVRVKSQTFIDSYFAIFDGQVLWVN